MIRFIIFTIIVILIETGTVYYVSMNVDMRFLDLMFYMGVLFLVVTLFFSSSGGLISNLSNRKVMGSLNGMFGGFQHKRTFASININPFVVGSTLFLIIGILLATFFY